MRRFLATLTAALMVSVGGLHSSKAEEGDLIEVTNLTFNTSADEDDPHLAEGGLALYYTLSTKGEDNLRVARRRGAASAWPAKTTLIDDYIKNKGETRSAFATQGRYPQWLYFAAKDDKGKNYDLFVSVKQAAGRVWTEPTPVMNVNSEEDECFPWVAADNKALYFSRKTKDGWKLMISTRTNAAGPGGWRDPEEVGLLVGFHHATLTPDGKTMIVQGPLEKDRVGLFLCTKAGKVWGKPEPITGLNHPEGKIGDRAPNLSRDGSMLYFASDRPGGKGGLDVYAAKMANVRKKK
jgi:WD40-like Beta Propeller Repeat